MFESACTYYRYDKTAGVIPDYISRAAAIEQLREKAMGVIASAERLLAVIDAGEVVITWRRGWEVLPEPADLDA